MGDLLRVAALAAALAATACGPSTSPATRTGTGGAAASPAPAALSAPDLALFVEGTTWRFALEHSERVLDDAGAVASDETFPGEASCKVTEVRPLADGKAALLWCDGGLDATASGALAGWWAGTSRGLWYLTTEPSPGDAIGAEPGDTPLLALPAAAEEHVEPMDEGEIRTRVYAEGGAWCAHGEARWPGNTSWSELCVDATGPVRGGSGGSDETMTHGLRFTRLP